MIVFEIVFLVIITVIVIYGIIRVNKTLVDFEQRINRLENITADNE